MSHSAPETRSEAAVLREAFCRAPLKYRLVTRNRIAINPIAPLLAMLPPCGTLLDVGCGSGLLLLCAARRERISRGHGIDRDARALGAAEQAAARMGASAPLSFSLCASFAEWPGERFDTVALIDVMHHIPRALQTELLDAAGRRVRDGGRILYKDMCIRPCWRALANRAHDLLVSRQWIHYLPLARVIEWGARNGYAPVHIETYSKWCYGHELLVLDKQPARADSRALAEESK
ncbi:MAG: class I SAM-dependent methyltransferase [Gammaproteobacteria bacterium]